MISGGFRMPRRSPFQANLVNDARDGLPPALEARIAALETAAPDTDFDSASWIWMVSLGVVLPAALIVLGW